MKAELQNIQKLRQGETGPKHSVTINTKYKKYWKKSGLKHEDSGEFFLNHVREKKPKNFLEIGVFHGVTSRNVCDLLHSIHENDFKFTGIDLFQEGILKEDYAPNTKFSNPLKNLYYNYLIRMNPYSLESVQKLLKKYAYFYQKAKNMLVF